VSELILTVYDGTERVDTIEGIESLQWMPLFAGAGEIKLVCAGSEKNLSLLQPWRRLYNPDTPTMAAVIIYVQSELTDKGALRMMVRGRFSLWWWSRRACTGRRTVTDAVSGLLSIAAEYQHGLPVTLPDSGGISAACEEVIEWCDCLTAFEQLAKVGKFGLCHTFKPETGAETLAVVWGRDRSDPASDDYRGYLGTMSQNVGDVTVTIDGTDYANVAICYAETSERPTVIVEVGASDATGTDRHELLVDGSSVKYGANYEDSLRRYAEGALLNSLIVSETKATAADTNLVYGRDYQLGDILPIIVPELHLRASAQVESVRLIYEKGRRTVRPVFGKFSVRRDDT